MAKLHELLAVSSNLSGQYNHNRLDLQNTFEKKRHHFSEKLVTVKYSVEGMENEQREQTEIQTTVKQEVDWISAFFAKAVDSAFAIDLANTQAKADIVLESGDIVAKGVPATALLQLAKRVKEVLEFIKTIPTLDPAKGFQLDPAKPKGIFVAREVLKPTTKKVQQPLILAPATDKHAAQVQLVVEDVRIGTIHEQEWSSLITPAVKADLLDRGEMLLRAVQKARSRANDTDIDTTTHKIGKMLLEYVFQPLSI